MSKVGRLREPWHPLSSQGIKWSEGLVGRALARGLFKNSTVLLVQNCYWTGFETDLLGVTKDLRLIDIEIKISRGDLKADLRKDKWWQRPNWRAKDAGAEASLRGWPPKVWKHYYCLPFDVWRDDLVARIPANSGVLLLVAAPGGAPNIMVKRRATPNRDAPRISHVDAIDIARLANIRMWEALARSNSQGTKRPRIKVLP